MADSSCQSPLKRNSINIPGFQLIVVNVRHTGVIGLIVIVVWKFPL